jgi:hypothetical protein
MKISSGKPTSNEAVHLMDAERGWQSPDGADDKPINSGAGAVAR